MLDRSAIVVVKKKARSRLSNGHALPRSIDQRTAWARRFRDLLALHLNDLGGFDHATEAEKAIIRRACTLITEAEIMEEGFARHGGAKLDELEIYQRISSTMRRLLESVGLGRRAKDVTPSLEQYLKTKSRQQIDAEAAE